MIKHAVGAALSDFDSAKIMLEILILLKSVSTGIILEWISKLPNSYSFHGVQFDNFPKLVSIVGYCKVSFIVYLLTCLKKHIYMILTFCRYWNLQKKTCYQLKL